MMVQQVEQAVLRPQPEQEKWRPVPYPELGKAYEVSNFGRVRRSDTQVLLKSSPTGDHHRLQIKLWEPGKKQRQFMLAHLVYGAFYGIPERGYINPKDGNLANCRAENLFVTEQRSRRGERRAGPAFGVGRIHGSYWCAMLDETAQRIFQQIAPETEKLLRKFRMRK